MCQEEAGFHSLASHTSAIHHGRALTLCPWGNHVAVASMLGLNVLIVSDLKVEVLHVNIYTCLQTDEKIDTGPVSVGQILNRSQQALSSV